MNEILFEIHKTPTGIKAKRKNYETRNFKFSKYRTPLHMAIEELVLHEFEDFKPIMLKGIDFSKLSGDNHYLQFEVFYKTTTGIQIGRIALL